MSTLNHPLKRLFFVLFIGSGLALLGMALLPAPFEVSSYADWKDAVGSDTVDRQVTRIDTTCAGSHVGSIGAFAKDFFIVDANASANEFARFMTETKIERGEAFSIAEEVDLTEKEKIAFGAELSNPKKPCVKGVCVNKLDPSIFAAILKSCSEVVGQHREDKHRIRWRISENLEETYPWSLFAFIASLVLLLLSLLYERTLGSVVKWIRTGTC